MAERGDKSSFIVVFAHSGIIDDRDFTIFASVGSVLYTPRILEWMRTKVRIKLYLLIALLSIILMTGSTPPPAEAAGPLVLAFYYAWYDMSTWGSGQLPDLPAQQYVSADAGTISRHVSEAKSAGIDGLVQSWYGPGGNNQTEGNFQILLNTAAAQGLKAAVDFEAASPYFAGPQDRIAALQHLLSVHANHPAYLRVDGKPVVFFWASWLLSVNEWADIRAQVDPGHNSIWIVEGASLDYLSVFDGLHLYNIAWSDNPAGTLAYWGGQVRAQAAALGSYKYWAATVMPGWDDTRIPGRGDAFVRDRAGGAYYQQCWSGAVASGPDMVIITSFNEWLEGSMIEPSVSYGDYYLNLTGQLAAAYKAGGVPAPPPLPTAGPTITPQPTVPPTPTNTPGPSPTPTSTATPRPSPTPLPDGSIVHIVQEGDTLLGIGETYGVALDELLVLNGLERESLLWIGQSIVIGVVNWTATPTWTPSLTPTAPVILETTVPQGGGAAGEEATGEGKVVEALEGDQTSTPEGVLVIIPPTITVGPDVQSTTTLVPPPGETPSSSTPALPCTGGSLLLIGAALCLKRGRRGGA